MLRRVQKFGISSCSVVQAQRHRRWEPSLPPQLLPIGKCRYVCNICKTRSNQWNLQHFTSASDGQITSLGKMRVGQPANQIPYMTRNPPMIVFKSSDWPFWLVGLIRNLQKVKIWVLRESNLGKWQHISRIFFFFWLRSQIFGFGLARQPMERFEQSEILTLLVLFHQWKRL